MNIKLLKLALSLARDGNARAADQVFAQFTMPFLRKNYDYSSESLYHGEMDRFKSVDDFLKKRKKKQNYKPKDLRVPIHKSKKKSKKKKS